jgi:hypothetical protein
MSTDIPSQIQIELEGLDAAKQRQVLEYVRGLKQLARGMSGATLKRMAGTLSVSDAKSMVEAIDAGCEQVDSHGW